MKISYCTKLKHMHLYITIITHINHAAFSFMGRIRNGEEGLMALFLSFVFIKQKLRVINTAILCREEINLGH